VNKIEAIAWEAALECNHPDAVTRWRIIEAAIKQANEPLVNALKEFENEYPHVTRILNNNLK